MATETLGFLLQGVSQQQAKVRSAGQVTEQVNFLSDVNKGLTTRPGTERLGSLVAITPDDSKSFTIRVNDIPYRIVLTANDRPKVYDYTGAVVTVTGDVSNAYISTNAAVYTYDETVYITNRDMVVALGVDTYTSMVRQNWGYVYSLGGLFNRKYEVTLTVGTVAVTGTYTTPDGTTAGDPNLATADHIATQLKTSLDAALSVASIATVTITRVENHLRIVASGNNLTDLTTKDGEGSTTLRGGIAKAETLADMPKYSAHGDYLKIFGATDAADDFWMRFVVEGITDSAGNVGTNYGKAGAWREYFDVTVPVTFDADTMPHALTHSAGTFTFGPAAWEHRQVGNEDSNPTPSFVGHTIRDIREFQSRLAFATGAGTVVMSKTDGPTDFWKKSATTDVASDVIDMRATQEGTKPFDWMVPFDRDLFVLSPDSQFVISGSSSLAPGNASMVLATNYNMSSNARPQATGRTLLIPFKGQRYAGVNEYFTSNDSVSTSVDNLNKTSSKYIEGEIREIVSSSNEGLALFITDQSYIDGYVWVYKYLWEFEKKTQSAWSKWKFPGKVRHAYASDGVVYFWIVIGDGAVFMGSEPVSWDGEEAAAFLYADLEEIVVSMRLDIPEQFDFDYALAIDGSETGVGTVVGDYLEVVTRYTNPAFILNSTSENAPPGGVIVPDEIAFSGLIDDTTLTYKFNIVDRPWLLEGDISFGQRIERYFDPSPPVPRKYDGTPRSDVQIIVNAYYVDYLDSGQFSVQMRSAYRGNEVMANTDWFPLDDDPFHPWNESVRSGTLQAPWGEYSQLATLRVFSDDIRPTTIQEIRYQPQYMTAGG